MRWMVGLVGWLLLVTPTLAAEHVLAWTYTTQPQDRDFVVERCTNRPSGCRLGRLATVSRTTRQYTDRTVNARRSYCYQVGVRDQQSVYQWSNLVCGR